MIDKQNERATKQQKASGELKAAAAPAIEVEKIQLLVRCYIMCANYHNKNMIRSGGTVYKSIRSVWFMKRFNEPPRTS